MRKFAYYWKRRVKITLKMFHINQSMQPKRFLSAMKNDLIKAEDSANPSTETIVILRIRSIISAINYLLGVISIETEELSTGDEHLMKCLETLEGREL